MRHKIVVVLGTTGAGKSQLAIEIAQKIRGEIINADSMQIYKGLDIATNKVTQEEMQEIPHHLLGFLDPSVLDFNSSKFSQMAAEIIPEIISRGNIPIIVGGTHYYIEALLWGTDTESDAGKSLGNLDTKENCELIKRIEQGRRNGENDYDILKEIDPIMGEKLHPNDTRKIKKSLQYILDTGVLYSTHLKHKNAGKKIKYSACVICVHCEDKILKQRLDSRVETMIQRGLLTELHQMYNMDLPAEVKGDYTKGIFQAIGYKEFSKYFQHVAECGEDEHSKVLLQESIEKMKTNTRRYAKVQLSWIRNKLQPLVKIHFVDSTDLHNWENVLNSALSIVQRFLSEDSTTTTEIPKQIGGLDPLDQWKKFHCEICERTLNGNAEWEAHLKSKGHRSNKRKKNKNCATTINSV